MAKIPFLYGQQRANGETAWHWKPSPRLRKLGWKNQHLGDSRGKQPPIGVIEKALDLNRQLEAWDLGFTAATSPTPPVPKKWTWFDLVDHYRASNAYRTEIEAATRREYDSRIRQLTYWAQDGRLYIKDMDQQMVRDLKTTLLGNDADGKPGSRFKCAAMLRVLRMLMNFAKNEGIAATNPTDGVPIPTPPSRKAMLTWRDIEDISLAIDGKQVDEDYLTMPINPQDRRSPEAAAHFRENADLIGLRALRFGFWTMQRRADLVELNRFHWRELHGADPRDLPALVNAKGEVWGFRVKQQKTDATVDCPMPAFLHAEIEAAFAKSQWLFPHPLDPTKPMTGDVLRRRARPLLNDAGFPHLQLRDMRRSGMSWVKDMGADKSDVFAISGHPLDGQQKTMADVYMPPNSKAACRAIAAAVRTMQAVAARERAND